MPAPNNKMDRNTQKALVIAKLEEGKTWKEVSKEVGVAESTIWRWMKAHESEPKEVETIKQALNLLDYKTLEKLSYLQDLIIDELINKAGDDELKELGVKELSRAGVEVAKMFGIRTDKVIMREGGFVMAHQPPSVAAVLAACLAKAEMDRQATARIKAETKLYEATYKEKRVIDV